METKKNKALECRRERNVAPQKKFNAARQGHGSQQEHKGDGTRWLECWTYHKEHLNINYPQNKGGRPKIYIAQEAYTIGDVGQSVPRIYATLDNKQVD